MLLTTVGAYSSNSYITLEEAEETLATLDMRTDAWIALTASQEHRITGTVSGPFIITPGINDTLLISIVEGDEDDQTIFFEGGGEAHTEPVTLTVTQVCVIINDQTSDITATPEDNKIKLSGVNPVCTLYIKSVAKSLCSTFGLAVGEYPDTVSYQKEYMLKIAAQLIGMMPLTGRRVYTNQTLDFPRNIQLDVAIIPHEVEEAQALLACLVVQPNLDRQVTQSESLYSPTGLQNLVVKEVKVAGIMDVKASETASADITVSTRSLLESFSDVFLLPVYMRMKPFLTQISGGSLVSPDDYSLLLLPAVEETDLSELDPEIDIDGGDFTP
jgi:hypothetical protein